MDSTEHDPAFEAEEEVKASSGNLMDSRTSNLDDRLLDQLEEAFHTQTSQVLLHDLAKIASEHNPVDLAYAVTRLPAAVRAVVYQNLPSSNDKIQFMVNTGSTTRLAVFREINDEEVRSLIEKMPPDEAVALLDEMPERRLNRILNTLEPQTARKIRALRQHKRDTAGRIMTNELFAFLPDTTVGEVAAAIRDNPGIDLTRWIFVLDAAGELKGFVPSRNLIVNPSDLPLKKVMQPILHQVQPDASREEIIDLVERYKIPALPVVDDNNILLGVITYEDVVELMEDLADETIAYMAGTSEDVSEHEPILKRFLSRAPWLIVTLLAGLTIATILDHFSGRPWYLFVPVFVPLITGMSGAVGIQCSTILVRSMATGELSAGTKWEAMGKELTLGMMTGGIFGVGCGVFAYFMGAFGVHEIGPSPMAVGTIVSVGVMGAATVSTLLGVFLPFLFLWIRIDPAIASGPLVTAFNDTLSTLVFCFIAFILTGIFF